MALYGPFYAGKNAPGKERVKWTRKKKNVKPESAKPQTRKMSCSEAAKQLSKCRSKNRSTALNKNCKLAGKTLYACRKK
jgi:hypothetical protein